MYLCCASHPGCLSRQPREPTHSRPRAPCPGRVHGSRSEHSRSLPRRGAHPGHGGRSAACVCWDRPGAAGRRGPEAGGAGAVLRVGTGRARLARGFCGPGGEPARSWREPAPRPQADGVGQGCSPRSSGALPVGILGFHLGEQACASHAQRLPAPWPDRQSGGVGPAPRTEPPCGTGQPVPRPRCRVLPPGKMGGGPEWEGGERTVARPPPPGDFRQLRAPAWACSQTNTGRRGCQPAWRRGAGLRGGWPWAAALTRRSLWATA